MSVSAGGLIPPLPPSTTLETGGPQELIRALLEVLETLSGLGCIYVTRFHERASTLEVAFSQHTQTGALVIPEGLEMPWHDTLSQRAIKDSVHFTEHADDLWADSNAVQHLGIRTFLSEPIRDATGELIGTLCGISGQQVPVHDDTLYVFHVFARLIAHQLARHDRFDQWQEDLATLKATTLTDPLTGIANRQALVLELARGLARAARTRGRVAVVFIDLDRFKAINDTHGHRTGDRFLVSVAGRLVAGTRTDEFVARYGGDEFVVVAFLDLGNRDGAEHGLAQRFLAMTQGRFQFGDTVIDYPGASVGTALSTTGDNAESLLNRANKAMVDTRKAGSHRPAEDPTACH